MRFKHHVVVALLLLLYPALLLPQSQLLDSLLQQLTVVEQRPSDTATVQYWNNLSATYRLYANDSLHAVLYARKAAALARELSYTTGLALAHHNMGLAFFQQARYDEALDAHEQALELRRRADDKRGTARSLNGIGLVYQYQGRYDKALEMYFAALPVHEQIYDTVGLGVVYDNIGTVYRLQGKFTQALEFYQKALLYHRAEKIRTNEAYSLKGIGEIYMAERQYRRALEVQQQVLHIRRELGHQQGIAATLNDIGAVYYELHEYQQALQAHSEALGIQERLSDQSGYARSLYSLGLMYEAMGNTGKALDFARQSLSVAQGIGAKNLIYQSGFLASRLLKTSGKLNEALELYELATKTKDSVFSEESGNRIAELSAKYDLDKKQREIELLEKNNEITTIWRNSLVVGIVLLFVLVVVVIIRFRENKRANAEILRQQTILSEQAQHIEIMNTELQQVNDELEQKNAQLISLNDEKNEFMGIAAHDLKNPLSSIRNLAQIMEHESGDFDEAEVREYSTLIRQAADQMFDLTKNLLDVNAIEQGKLLLHCAALDVSTIITEVMHHYEQRAIAKNLTLRQDIPDVIRAIADETALVQVMDNLISNAVKYSPPGTRITVVVCYVEPDNAPGKQAVKISVRDEGPGLSDEDKAKLFGKFARLSALPTGGEHSTGLGLSIVKKMVELMQGRVWCESSHGKGATFIVELPAAAHEE